MAETMPPTKAASNAAWGSDVVAQTIRALGYRYISLVPGASFRGLHDSLVNHLGNANPQMVVCLHEEHAVSIADGYSRVADEPMAVALHSNVGLMHATMAIFNAWCDRRPMLIDRRDGAGRRPQATAVDRLGPYLPGSGLDHPPLYQMGRSAGFRGGGGRSGAARGPDRAHEPLWAGLCLPRCGDAGKRARPRGAHPAGRPLSRGVGARSIAVGRPCNARRPALGALSAHPRRARGARPGRMGRARAPGRGRGRARADDDPQCRRLPDRAPGPCPAAGRRTSERRGIAPSPGGRPDRQPRLA